MTDAMQQKIFDDTRERKLRELMFELNSLVMSGDLTSEQANEWYNDKADQWRK
jgi:hypothetical protein